MTLLTADQHLLIQDSRDRAYSAKRLPIAHTRDQVRPEIAIMDAWLDANRDAVLGIFSPAFQLVSTEEDRAILTIAVIVARQLAESPDHLSILRSMLSDLEAING